MPANNVNHNEVKSRIRLNISEEELRSLANLLDEQDVTIGPLTTLSDKVRLVMFKLDMDMGVSSYPVRATPKPKKYSTSGLGFNNDNDLPFAVADGYIVPVQLPGESDIDYLTRTMSNLGEIKEITKEQLDRGELG